MRRVVQVLTACAILAMPLRSGDATASPGASGREEYSATGRANTSGRESDGLKVLEETAGRNVLTAQLRLAKLYEEGTQVPKNELKACQLYEAAVDGHPGFDRMHPEAASMGEALRSLGLCYLKGLNAPGWERDTLRAADLFLQAGAIFEDRVGLFELAKLYLKGDGVRQNPRLAINYLYTAARKRYAPAQAILGSMMWEGKLMKPRPNVGLALLMLAREGASPEDRSWIQRAFDDAMLTASAEQEYESAAIAKNWKGSYGPDDGVETVNAIPVPSVINPAQPTSQTAAMPGTREADGVPLPVRAPWREEQNHFGSTPTGADVPPSADPLAQP